MAKYKVRHGLIAYDVGDRRETAFRGQVVELSQEEADRLKPFGAIVAEDEELPRPGGMLPLPETATDEEIRNWVLAATEAEVRATAEARPMLAERLESAHEAVKQDLREQAEHLGQAQQVAQQSAQDTSERNTPTTAAEQQQAESEVNVDDVVRGNATEISRFLSEHPEQAQAVLEAETRRAAADNDEPRKGVRRAAEAAAGHANQ